MCSTITVLRVETGTPFQPVVLTKVTGEVDVNPLPPGWDNASGEERELSEK